MRAKWLLIAGAILFLGGLVYLKFACRNSDSVRAHISNLVFNNNTIILDCSGIERNDVDVFWKDDGETKKLIINSGQQIGQIRNEYGPNGLEVIIENDKIFKVGHWKTANWHSHDYRISLVKDSKRYEIKFIAEGPDYKHSEQEFDLNGKPDGLYRSYYENGNLSVEGTYNDGLQHGIFKDYYKNGKLRVSNAYLHGKLNGYDISYSEDGKVEYKTKYSNGNRIEE